MDLSVDARARLRMIDLSVRVGTDHSLSHAVATVNKDEKEHQLRVATRERLAFHPFIKQQLTQMYTFQCDLAEARAATAHPSVGPHFDISR